MDPKTGVALIGSESHLIGEAGTPVHAAYARPSFLRKLADGIRELGQKEIEENSYGTYYAARGVAFFHEGDTLPVEFVAKYLLKMGDVLIGSPIYVAAL